MKQKKSTRILKAYAFGPALYASDSDGRITILLELTTFELVDGIIAGEFRGLSPALKIRKWKCSVCQKDFETCPHEVGKRYGEVECRAMAQDIEPIETSIVDVPKDGRCRIIDLLLIKEEDHQRKYEWHGFEVNADLDRFQSIQRALEQNLIPEKAAFHFGKFFSVKLVGTTSYP